MPSPVEDANGELQYPAAYEEAVEAADAEYDSQVSLLRRQARRQVSNCSSFRPSRCRSSLRARLSVTPRPGLIRRWRSCAARCVAAVKAL